MLASLKPNILTLLFAILATAGGVSAVIFSFAKKIPILLENIITEFNWLHKITGNQHASKRIWLFNGVLAIILIGHSPQFVENISDILSKSQPNTTQTPIPTQAPTATPVHSIASCIKQVHYIVTGSVTNKFVSPVFSPNYNGPTIVIYLTEENSIALEPLATEQNNIEGSPIKLDIEGVHRLVVGNHPTDEDTFRLIALSTTGEMRMWDISPIENNDVQIRPIPVEDGVHTASVNNGVFVNQGKHFVSISDDGKIAIWEVSTGRHLETHEIDDTETGIHAITVYDENIVAIGDQNGRLMLIEVEDVSGGINLKICYPNVECEQQDSIEGEPESSHTSDISSLVFFEYNEKTFLASLGLSDGKVKLWEINRNDEKILADVAIDEPKNPLPLEQTESIYYRLKGIGYNNYSDSLVIVGEKHTLINLSFKNSSLKLVQPIQYTVTLQSDSENNTQVLQLSGHYNEILSVALLEQSPLMATGGGNTDRNSYIYDLTDQLDSFSLDLDENTTGVQLSASDDGKYLAAVYNIQLREQNQTSGRLEIFEQTCLPFP